MIDDIDTGAGGARSNWPLGLLVVVFLTLAGALIFSSTAAAASWFACADSLDSLRSASSSASDMANAVKSKESDLDSCTRYPQIYDLLKDGCSYQNSSYQSAIRLLQLELASVRSRSNMVNLSCGNSGPQVSSGNPMCDLFNAYKGTLPNNTLLESCRKSMSDAECRRGCPDLC